MTDLQAPGLAVGAAREFRGKPLKRLNPRPGLRQPWPSPHAQPCFETRRVASLLSMSAGRFGPPPRQPTAARKTRRKPLKRLNPRPGLRRPWRSPRAQPCFETRRVASVLSMSAGRFGPPPRQPTAARKTRRKPLKRLKSAPGNPIAATAPRGGGAARGGRRPNGASGFGPAACRPAQPPDDRPQNPPQRLEKAQSAPGNGRRPGSGRLPSLPVRPRWRTRGSGRSSCTDRSRPPSCRPGPNA